MPLGRWPDVTISDARKRKSAIVVSISDGVDPWRQRAEERRRKPGFTLNDAFAEWLETAASEKPTRDQDQLRYDMKEIVALLEARAAETGAKVAISAFWEKATAVHLYCGNGDMGDRHSRHWHDLVRLDETGYAKQAIADCALAKEIAEFKSRFFREKDRKGNPIDYMAAHEEMH